MTFVNINIARGHTSPPTAEQIERYNENMRAARNQENISEVAVISYDERWQESAKAIRAAGQQATQAAILAETPPSGS